MDTIDKRTFLEVLKIKPQSVIGKEIIYSVKPVRILDVSIGGDMLLLESSSTERTWVLASGVDDNVIIDTFHDVIKAKPFTVSSLTQSIKALEELVGKPSSEQSKPLFEIVAALNKAVFELGQKVDGKFNDLKNIRELIKLYNQATAELRQKIEEIELKLEKEEKKL